MARRTEALEAQLNQDVSLVRLAEEAGVALEARGTLRGGPCPFHEDKQASLEVDPQRNVWTCSICGTGDAVGWVARLEGVSRSHAVRLLDEGCNLSGSGDVSVSTTPKLATFSAKVDDARLMAQVCGYYQSVLTRSPDALAYLEARGLKCPELIDTFLLGYADRTLGYRLPAKNRAAGADLRGALQRLGLYRASGHEHFSGALVIPVRDAEGQIVQAYGRKIRDNLRMGTPFHLTTPHCGEGIWNYPALEASDEIILAKNLIDGLTFWSAGYRNVTACVSPGLLPAHMLEAFTRNGVRRVLIGCGRDPNGDAQAEAVAVQLTQAGMEAFRLSFSAGHDANSHTLSAGDAPDALGAVIRSAEWIGAGKTPKRVARVGLDVVADPDKSDEATELAELDELDCTSDADVAAPPVERSASPIPPAQEIDSVAEQDGPDVRFQFEDRRWRVRGLRRNTSYETLRINLLVSRALQGRDVFHVDLLDLYAARPRAAFVKQASLETSCSSETIKADMARILLELEDLQDRQIKAALGPVANLPEIDEADRNEALALLKRPDLLDQIVIDAHACGIVGEEGNILAAYLASVSRKLDKPLAVLIQSTSAAGKSALMDAVLAFVPEEDRFAYSAMTGQALYYLGSKDLRHKVLAVAEEEGARDAAYALKLLQSQGSLAIASTGKDPLTGKLVTQDYAVEGPVSLMMTTTAIDLDEELKNRCLVLTVDENREQTRAIHQRQRYEETLEGLEARAERQVILSRHQNAQRLLKPLRVVNPYACKLTFLDHTTRTRRDHGKYLSLIRSVALLHQHQRAVKAFTRSDGETMTYIEVTEADIAAANRIAHAVLGRTLDDVPPQTRKLLDQLLSWARLQAEVKGVHPREIGFTRREVREVTGWGHTQLKVHLRRLLELEYILVKRAGGGGPCVYELVYDGQGPAEGRLMGLIAPQALESHVCGQDRSGQESDRSGPGRGVVGPWSVAGQAATSPANTAVDAGNERRSIKTLKSPASPAPAS